MRADRFAASISLLSSMMEISAAFGLPRGSGGAGVIGRELLRKYTESLLDALGLNSTSSA
jgi:hypothetical protein